MKVIISVPVVLLLALFFVVQANAQEYDFRKAKWGMSKEQVRSSESLDVAKDQEGLLGYKSVVLEKNVFIAYFFVEDQLVRARYVLADTHSNSNDFIQDYKDFKEILTKKYGKPKKDEVIWRNDLYKDDYSHWGMAVSVGHLMYFATWNTENTEIADMLMGENYNATCIVEYNSKKLKEVEKKAREKKELDAF